MIILSYSENIKFKDDKNIHMTFKFSHQVILALVFTCEYFLACISHLHLSEILSPS